MSETQATADEPKKLHGAAAAAAAKKASGASGTSLTDFLAQIANGLDEKLAEAQALVEAKQVELDEAKKNVRTLQALKSVHDGTFQLTPPPSPAPRQRATGGTRSPRAHGREVQDKIAALLKDAGPDGVQVAEIIQKVAHGGDAKQGQAVRNQLATMKKHGKVGNANGAYFLPM